MVLCLSCLIRSSCCTRRHAAARAKNKNSSDVFLHFQTWAFARRLWASFSEMHNHLGLFGGKSHVYTQAVLPRSFDWPKLIRPENQEETAQASTCAPASDAPLVMAPSTLEPMAAAWPYHHDAAALPTAPVPSAPPPAAADRCDPALPVPPCVPPGCRTLGALDPPAAAPLVAEPPALVPAPPPRAPSQLARPPVTMLESSVAFLRANASMLSSSWLVAARVDSRPCSSADAYALDITL